MSIAAPVKRRNNLLRFASVPPSVLGITIAASWLGMVAMIVLGYPLYVIGIVTILPWLPVFLSEALWKYRHYAWFAFFEILIVAQTLHFIEHIAQIVEVDVVGWPRSLSAGIIGQLNAEYVHFSFDTGLLIGTIILLFRFKKNIGLWITLLIAIWHTAEHWYITYFYAFDYANYDPNNPTGLHAHEGLLARGGLLWPNSPFPRIELHFIYNLLFTVPFVWGFILVIRDAYDEYLKKAFPRLSEAQLASLNTQTEVVTAEAGTFIIRQGEPADRFYIISRGEVEILQQTGSNQPVVVNRLTQGQFFGEVGLLTGAPRNASVRAVTRCELLALNRETFRSVIGSSVPTAQDYAQLLAQRSGARIPAAALAGAGGSGGALAPGVFPSGGGVFPPGGGSGPAIPAPPASPGTSSGPVASPPAWPGAQMAAPGFQTGPTTAFTPPRVSGPAESPTAPTSVNLGAQAPQPSVPPTAPPPSDKTLVETQAPQFRSPGTGWAYGLIFSSGEQAGQGIVLSAERMQIGRDLGNEIRLGDDSKVSRRHAELVRIETGEYLIRDLGSSNGVFVNEERLAVGQGRVLKEEDQVRIGNTTFTLRRVGTRVV